MHALPEAVILTDATGVLLFGNHNAQAFLGEGAPALIGQNIRDVLGADSAAIAAFKKISAGQPSYLHDVAVAGKFVDKLTVTPIQHARGLLLWTFSYEHVRRSTPRSGTTLQPALHMARVLAHEIKNPLSGIRGAAQLLMRARLKPDDADLAALIDRETQRIARIVDKANVFDDAAPPSVFEPVNLHAVIDHVLHLAKSGCAAHVRIVRDFDPSLPDVMGDKDALMQAVLNIVKNAAEAAPAREGVIVVRSYYDMDAVFHAQSGNRLPVCIDIEDNGEGMSQEAQRRAFDPYYTTKSQGLGLGLAVVLKIIDDHGGIINVSSVTGKTVFKISFPMPKSRKYEEAA